MKKKLKKFFESTRNINFLMGTEIVSNFNSSIVCYKRFQELLNGGDKDRAGEKLRDAGNKLYATCEWAYKHYLNRRYNEKQKEGSVSNRDADKKRSILTSKNPKECNIAYLAREMKEHANPPINFSNINLNTIAKFAFIVNNGPKHAGEIPSPKEFLIVADEVRGIIKTYVDPNAELITINDSVYGEENAWYEFMEDCDEFSDSNSYVLITGRLLNYEHATSLFYNKWDLVIDMDPSSDIDGLAMLYQKITHTNPWIRDLSFIDSKKTFSDSSISYWLMAAGYRDKPETMIKNDNWMEWNKKYGRNLQVLLENFHKAYTKPVKIIVIPNLNSRIIEKIVESFNVSYGDSSNVDFYVLSSDNAFGRIEDENFKKTNLSYDALIANFNNFMYKKVDVASSGIKIPKDIGDVASISNEFHAVIRDSFELVYLGIENEDNEKLENISPELFYNGSNDISWYGLRKNYDVQRAAKKEIVHKIYKNIEEKARVLLSIQYEAGIGGTTFMRRMAWEFHEKTPTVILINYEETKTANILREIYIAARLPILILADSNNILISDIRKLYIELRALGFSFSIYVVQRKMRDTEVAPMGILNRLKKAETEDMMDSLLPYATTPKCIEQLQKICHSGLDDEERSPFIMSMYAFKEDFHGIKPYIANYLKKLNLPEKKILFYISLADYANAKIDVQFFEELFENKSIDSFLSINGVFRSLIKYYKIGGKKYFKIKYHQFANAILKQLSDPEGERIIFSNVMSYIFSFIEDSRRNQFVSNQDTIELLRSLFITREEDSDAQKPAFSPLIEKLRNENKVYDRMYDESVDIIVRIFERLVEIYPEEPHFIGHLSRYYFYVTKNYPAGFREIEKAISISKSLTDGEGDCFLYHMKAMGYSSRICNYYIPLIHKYFNNGDMEEITSLIENIHTDAASAFELFKQAREGTKGIAGYISEIKLCAQIFNMGKYVENESDSVSFTSRKGASIYMDYLDRACTLLEECKKIAVENDESKVREVEISLETLKNGIERNIDIWEEYLSGVKGTERPRIRRMLARAYQDKIDKSKAKNEDQKDIQRIISLMEENIESEPDQSGNIRIWFNAIRHLKTDRPDAVISDAVINLNRWVVLTDSPEAHYYRFILKFLQAESGSISAEQDLPKLLKDMKERTLKLYNRTVIHEWIGRDGDGLERLINNQEYRQTHKNEEDLLGEYLQLLTGRIDGRKYVNDTHAYISSYGLDIFFNPRSTDGIDSTKTNQRVRFGMGFSYDGPRAFHKSIKLIKAEDIKENKHEKEQHLCAGMVIKCEVIENTGYYVNVRIIGEPIRGSIRVDDGLAKDYSADKRPTIGLVFDALVLGKGYDKVKKMEIWKLTMRLPNENNHDLAPWQKQLKEFNV